MQPPARELPTYIHNRQIILVLSAKYITLAFGHMGFPAEFAPGMASLLLP